MKGSGFTFDSLKLLYYKYQKINFERGSSYIDSPNLIKKKKKKATINPQNEDDKCFQYVVN